MSDARLDMKLDVETSRGQRASPSGGEDRAPPEAPAGGRQHIFRCGNPS